MGGQYTRAAIALSAMTGNIGIHGGSACGGLHGIPYGHVFRNAIIPGVRNPAYPKMKSLRGNINVEERMTTRFHINKLGDALLKGKKGGYPADIKFALFAGSNFVNQTANSNKFAKALQRDDIFTVVAELWMTSTARYADIVLPVTSFAEKSDLTRPWPSGPCFGYINKAIDPIGECKDDIEIAEELAKRLGIENFAREDILELYISNLSSQNKEEIGKIEEINDKFLRAFTLVFPELKRHIKNYTKYKEDSIHRVELEEPYVAFKAQIEDPQNNPFPTPSGKIEIYCDQVASWNNPKCPPIPKYISTFENREDPLIEKFPLQLITPHARNRVHSQFYEVEWLREAFPHRMWINPVDAKTRGVENGDMCLVYNDRGTVAIEAFLTKRIIPGVIAIPEGAWYTPDKNGIDRGGCVNTLTKDAYTEGGGACTLKHPLVQVKKEEGGV
jgi:anaerobic dimethyl sulfoxide reductase subunit A